MSDKDDVIVEISSNTKISPKVTSRIFEFYISGYLLSPETYTSDFDVIRHAGPDDEVKIYLNTYGGDMFSGIQWMRVLNETEAHVTCSVEGACMSAGTMIFLSADRFEVTPHSMFMFHNYSGGTMGKGGELYDQIKHERKWSERLLNEVYEGFLTKQEIQSLLDNRDMWMDVDEVVSRMEKRIQHMQELAELEDQTKPESE